MEEVLRLVAETLNGDAGFRVGVGSAEYAEAAVIRHPTVLSTTKLFETSGNHPRRRHADPTEDENKPAGEVFIELVGGERFILSVESAD